MLNVKKKIFPEDNNVDHSKLLYDEEGLWSITHPEISINICNTLLKYTNNNSNIIDLTAGCGGNLISFGKYFNNVIGVEINQNRFNILKNNVTVYDLDIKLINDNCINYLDKDYDIFFIDPPWGGPNYKYELKLQLNLSNYELSNLLDMIKKKKIVVLKIPYNYDYNYIKLKYNVLEIEKYNNITIIYFKT